MSPIHLIGGLIAFYIVNDVAADILVLPMNGPFIEEQISDMPSTFDGELSFLGLRGVVVYAEPPDACKSLKPPPNTDNPVGKWIILIARYNCSFEDKIRNAQNANYDGVIVHNVGSDKLEPMSAKNATGINIYSVFISESKGVLLRDTYANPDYYVIIKDVAPFNIQTHLLIPFAIVVGICFIVMIIFMVVKCIKNRRRQRRHRLPASALNKIPTCKFQKGDPYETCIICLEDYVEGDKIRVLPCNHVYHTKCIDPWLTKNRRVCPICKRKVFAHGETPYDGSDSESDSDDTTPLVNPNRAQTTQGGTFEPQTENPFQRAACSISQQSQATNFVTASDHHSINGEVHSDDSSSYTGSTECLIQPANVTVCENVHVHVIPGTSNPERDNESIA